MGGGGRRSGRGGRGGAQGDGGRGRGSRSNVPTTEDDELERKMGFELYTKPDPRLGWLMNMSTDGSMFKSQVKFQPYFYIATKGKVELEVDAYLRRKYEGLIANIQIVEKEDLDMKNHLSGRRRTFLKVSFLTVQNLMEVKKDILPVVARNQAKLEAAEAYESLQQGLSLGREVRAQRPADYLDSIVEVREYDVPYHVRYTIDQDVRCGFWYTVAVEHGEVRVERRRDLLQRAEPRVCAFDIETTKLPLKFPDAAYDAYDVDGDDIVSTEKNRLEGKSRGEEEEEKSMQKGEEEREQREQREEGEEVVGEDIADLEYTPKAEFVGPFTVINTPNERPADYLDSIVEVREYDVPYHVRYTIDQDVRCGFWYTVAVEHGEVRVERRRDLLQRAEPRVCAFDIETTKLPLKFPDAAYDAYDVDGDDIVSTEKNRLEGKSRGEEEEEKSMQKGEEEREQREQREEGEEVVGEDIADLEYTPKAEFVGPFTVINTPNEEIGFKCDARTGECKSKFACHLDCFAWVKRDSYLPQGSQGLKAVTKAKLGYDPLEVNPEDMVRFAIEKPQIMASYSVSDAVATYYLYMTYVHPFIFSLSTIIPMPPDEVLRKGSGTLCEMLLMVQAYQGNIICPNKHYSEPEKVHNGHLLESETYIGGHVECLESGVFRSDLPTKFRLVPQAYQQLIDKLDEDLVYALAAEGKMTPDDVSNYDEVKRAITHQLEALRDAPVREEKPVIYHLDVAAMYPNIMLTNRLQPSSVVTDDVCAACDFNRPGKTCLRTMEWVWRGEHFTATRSEYNHLKAQIESEHFPPATEGGLKRYFRDLPQEEQQSKLKDRLKKYCQKVYKRVLEKPVTEPRAAGVCQRENPFYIDTVRSFRDRRYEYKGLNKAWKGKLSDAKASGNPIAVQEAQVGKPLELDTDGIWCCLPASFPENFNNTNDQYQTLEDPLRRTYKLTKECSIEFEVDGPYKAMILPASKEEGVLIKKRYAVFNEDGSLAELKGFEIKRRGELKLIKLFQAEVFDNFLVGTTLEQCYDAVAAVANRWLDMLENRGIDLVDSELLEYISESSTMSKAIEDYGGRKSCAITTALRLADFLGEAMIKDKGLACQYIVAKSPQTASVSERAIPVAIFNTEPEVMRTYLRRWCKESKVDDVRSIVDWDYYRGRLHSAIQKIITIPAAMQKVRNPVPRVAHPDWLYKKVREKDDKYQQRTLLSSNFFHVLPPLGLGADPPQVSPAGADMEDAGRGGLGGRGKHPTPVVRTFSRRPRGEGEGEGEGEAAEGGGLSEEEENLEADMDARAKGGASGHSGPPQGEHGEGTSGGGEGAREGGRRARQRSVSPDGRADYGAWLEHRKRKWREQRISRKRLRLEEERAEAAEAGRPAGRQVAGGQRRARQAGVGAFYQRPRENILANSPWQIVQLAPTQAPGEFTAWVVAEGEMHRVPISVERVFYLNTRAPVTDDTVGERVTRLLPHGRPCLTLLQLTVGEEQFRDSAKELAAHLADPDLEGMYETKVPLALHAVLDVGCVCVVERDARHKTPAEGWALGELRYKTTTEFSYLTDDRGQQAIAYCFLYHSASEPRGLFALYTPGSSSVLVLVVQPFSNREVTVGQLQRHFREAMQQTGGGHQCGEQAAGTSFKGEAHKLLQRALVDFRAAHRGPTVALLECPAVAPLLAAVPALSDLPHVAVPCNGEHSQYQALGWQQVAARAAMQRCAVAGPWLHERIQLSQYAHLLWMSETGLPDLGGIAEEEEASFADEVQGPELTYSGAYRCMCVELTVNHLAVNALLKSGTVDEMEGGALLGGGDARAAAGEPEMPLGGRTSYDDSAADLFKYVELQETRYWHSLLFMDQYNFGGIPAEGEGEMEGEGGEEEPAPDGQPQIVSCWNISEYLPHLIQDYFVVVVSEFIYRPWKHARDVAEACAAALLGQEGPSCTPSVTLAAGADAEAGEIEFLKSEVKSYFTEKLLRIVKDVQKHISSNKRRGGSGSRREGGNSDSPDDGGGPAELADEDFPQLAGSHLEMGSPALEFIKFVCTVLSLDQRVAHHVLDRVTARAEGWEPESWWKKPRRMHGCASDGTWIRSDQEHSSWARAKLAPTILHQRLPLLLCPCNSTHARVARLSKRDGATGHRQKNLSRFVLVNCPALSLRPLSLLGAGQLAAGSYSHVVQVEGLVMRKQLLKLVHVREFSAEATFRDPCLSFTLPNVIC
eukprot:jgi/Mesen1/5612/ME000282S04761